MIYKLKQIEWVNRPSCSNWIGMIGEYELFEIYKDCIEKKYILESIIYSSIEKAIYSFYTFGECEQKAYSLLTHFVTSLLDNKEEIKRIKL